MTGCLPKLAVFHLVTFYRPTVESLAVVPENLTLELTQMYQFIFAAIRRTDLSNHLQKIRITADNERNARAKLAREFVLVLAGRINLNQTALYRQILSLQSLSRRWLMLSYDAIQIALQDVVNSNDVSEQTLEKIRTESE